jgi:hypothetical protein
MACSESFKDGGIIGDCVQTRPDFMGSLPGSVMVEDSTLRDYFAAKAMQAMIANNWLMNNASALDKLSVAAYEMADVMLLERAK